MSLSKSRSFNRWMAALVILAMLGAVFSLYTRADFVVQMANQLWTCF